MKSLLGVLLFVATSTQAGSFLSIVGEDRIVDVFDFPTDFSVTLMNTKSIEYRVSSTTVQPSACSLATPLTVVTPDQTAELKIRCAKLPAGRHKVRVDFEFEDSVKAKKQSYDIEFGLTVTDLVAKLLTDLSQDTARVKAVLTPTNQSCFDERRLARGETKKTVAKLFRKSSTLELDLDIEAGTLGYKTDGAEKSLSVSVEKRGISRKERCLLTPPMKMTFLSDKKDTLFEEAGRTLKVVFPCYGGNDPNRLKADNFYAPGEKDWEEFLNREYWVYKILEASGLPSLKVRRAVFKMKDKKIPGFFIEDMEDAVARVGGTPDEGTDKISIIQDQLLYALLSGTDDSGANHNGRSYEDAQKQLHFLAYDFDLSSLVFKNWDAWRHGLKPAQITPFSKGLKSEILPKIKTVLTNRQSILDTIEQSDLSDTDKGRFRTYYTMVLDSLAKRAAELQNN